MREKIYIFFNKIHIFYNPLGCEGKLCGHIEKVGHEMTILEVK